MPNLLKRSNLEALLVLIFGIALSFEGFNLVRNFEIEKIRQEFNDLAHDRMQLFAKETLNNVEVLHSLVGFFEAQKTVTREGFRVFTSHIIPWQSDILAISWSPFLSEADRPAFEEKMRKEGFPDFQILDLDSNGDFHKSVQRSEYFPIEYIEPIETNRSIIGLDLISELARKEAVEKTWKRNELFATSWIRLSKKRARAFACRVNAAVGRGKDSSGNALEGKGVVSVLFDIAGVARKAWAKLTPAGLNAFICDRSGSDSSKCIGFYGLKEQTPQWTEKHILARSDFRLSQTLIFSGRAWELIITSSEGFHPSRSSFLWWPNIVLAIGFLLSLLLAVHIRELLSRTAKIEKEVKQRTVELSQTNSALVAEILSRKQAEEELRRANEKLKEMDRLKSAFVANVSHELKNPLSVIKQSISLILEKLAGEINAEQREILEVSKHSINRLIRMVGDLLDLSQIELGKMRLKNEKVNMRELVEGVLKTYEREISRKQLGLVKEIQPDLEPVWGDQDKLTEAVINLLNNAIKYTTAGNISIKLTGAEQEVRFEVADSGPGIAKENFGKIFDKFERILTEKHEGTGLGLSLVKDIIELHKGKVWVESEMGKGSRFIFILPRNTAPH